MLSGFQPFLNSSQVQAKLEKGGMQAEWEAVAGDLPSMTLFPPAPGPERHEANSKERYGYFQRAHRLLNNLLSLGTFRGS